MFLPLGWGSAGEEVYDGWVGLVDFAKCLAKKKKASKKSSFLGSVRNCGEYIL